MLDQDRQDDLDLALVQQRGGALLITLNRSAKRNALSPELIVALGEALTGAAQDPSVSVIVITGAGESFCAGLDLKHLAGLDVDSRVEYMATAFALFRQVYMQPQPTIAAVNGPAMAGGFDLAAFCDLRLCSRGATFAQTEILLGLTQIMYPIYKVIGLARAKALALTGEAISSEEAYRIGLVHSVHAPDELLPRALDLADRLSSRPREALFETKRLGRELIDMDAGEAIPHMLDRISDRLRSEEQQDAMERYASRFTRRGDPRSST